MAAMTAQAPAFPITRRSSTVPSKLISRPGSHENVLLEETGGEDLYRAPSVRIVNFTIPSLKAINTEVGTLPWTSRLERVVAVGALRIYRPKGSVAFLQSGATILSLLPRSQCWCVDGESKFAMRIQQLIYRIELPYTTEEERAKVEELKVVLGSIIQYETTQCPFKRGFVVDLPEAEPETQRRMRLVGPYMQLNPREVDDLRRRGSLYRAYRGANSPDGSDEDTMSPLTTPIVEEQIEHERISAAQVADDQVESKTAPATTAPLHSNDQKLQPIPELVVRKHNRSTDKQRSVTAPPAFAVNLEMPTADRAVYQSTERPQDLKTIDENVTLSTSTNQISQIPPHTTSVHDEIPPTMKTSHLVSSNVGEANPEIAATGADVLTGSFTQHAETISSIHLNQNAGLDVSLKPEDDSVSARKSSLQSSTIALLSTLAPTLNSTVLANAKASTGTPLMKGRYSSPVRASRRKHQAQSTLLSRVIQILLSPPGDFIAILKDFFAQLLAAVSASISARAHRKGPKITTQPHPVSNRTVKQQKPQLSSSNVPGAWPVDNDDDVDTVTQSNDDTSDEDDDFGIPLVSPARKQREFQLNHESAQNSSHDTISDITELCKRMRSSHDGEEVVNATTVDGEHDSLHDFD